MSEKPRTDVFFRNADNYIKELVEVGHRQVAWDRGYLFKKRIDPVRHADLYFAGFPFRIWDIGNEEQGCAEYVPGCTRDTPSAVYPVISMMGENAIASLEELAANPSGENEEQCLNLDVPREERPVMGQDHIIIVTDLPDMGTGRGRSLIRTIRDVQADYPEATFHIHGLYGFQTMFGLGFKSVDYEPRSGAQKGKIILPVGREVKYEAAAIMPQWISLLGFKPSELSVPQARCIYNIKSTLWSADNFTESMARKFRRDPKAGPTVVDTTSPDSSFVPATTKSPLPSGMKILDGDKINCDTCSLSDACKVYRAGAVCSLTGDGKGLAAMFQTRDSGVVIDGLSKILSKQAERTERAMEDEDEFQETSPEVTKMLDGLFKNGIQFAKLIDPSLRAGPKVAVNIGGAGAITVGSERPTPQAIMKDVFAALEAQGFRREEITPDMIKTMMGQMYGPMPELPSAHDPRVIEA